MYSPGLALSRKRFLNLFAVFALLLAALPASGVRTAQAVSPNVVISQVYGGGGNSGAPYTHDFIELFNRGTVTATLSGWSVQYASATGTGNFGSSSTQITELPSVSLAPGQYLLIQEAAGTNPGSPLPAPFVTDATPIAMGGTAGKVALVNTATPLGCNGGSTPCNAAALAQIVDLVGYGNANFYEGGAPAPTLSNATSAQRVGGGCTDTDNNNSDFVTGAPAPRNTDSTLNPCQAVLVSVQASDASASETGPDAGSFTISRSGSTASALSVSYTVGGSAGNGTDYTPSLSGSATIAAGQSSVLVTITPVDDADIEGEETAVLTLADTANYDLGSPSAATVTIADNDEVVTPVCDQDFTAIFSIQGSGPSAAITGNVTTEGVVVGDFEGTSGLQGFYLQDVAGDDIAATSDGIFVFTGSANNVSVGDLVRVTGFARERFSQTAINGTNSNNSAVPAANIVACGTTALPAAATVTMPFESATYLERFEGMLVNFSQTLTIAEYFNYERFGELVLAYADGIAELGGEDRLFTPTGVVEPGAPANALAAQYALRRITLDDGLGIQNPSTVRHPNGGAFSLSNRFRGGDTLQNVVGVIGYDFDVYRIQPTGPADYSAVNLRTAAPETVGGNLRVAAMNTLNYFLTLDYPTGNPLDNKCGPAQNVECRGADADQPNEFSRQRDKLLAALQGLDADVLGLNELENTTGVDPLGDPTRGIVSGLNAALGAGTYASIDTGVIGTDAIRVGLIYKPAKVAPVGGFELLTSADDPRFIDTRSRPALAQTFEELATGARFTVVVNHLKSKGSACDGDPDTGDGQGNCNGTRTAAAQALVDWLATDPTGSGDPDFLIMGDLNSYAKEDPIDAILSGADDTAGTADDWTNLIAHYQGTYAYSYVFDGQTGYLDHALASSSMLGQVTGAADWHINADEPDLLDYDTSFKPPAQDAIYEPNAYRSSDHDPVVLGLVLNATPSVDAGGPYNVNEGGSVTVTATGSDPNSGDTLTYAWDLDDNGSFETPGQSATFSAASLDGPSSHTVSVKVTDNGGLSDVSSATVTVDNVAPQVGAITGPAAPVSVGTPVNVSASFTDPGTADTHTAVWSWGDNTTSPGVIVNGQVSGSHTYTAAGVYTVALTVTDDDSDSGQSTFEHVIVYNPAASVTGGGWVATAQGKANFNLNASYGKLGGMPQGQVGVNLPGNAGQFQSTSLDWLVVSGTSAQLMGSGTINGAGNYQFQVWAEDLGSTDTIRIKIWYTDGTGEHVVFDNGSTSTVQGGNIQVRDR